VAGIEEQNFHHRLFSLVMVGGATQHPLKNTDRQFARADQDGTAFVQQSRHLPITQLAASRNSGNGR
jgi:hypothetical protein